MTTSEAVTRGIRVSVRARFSDQNSDPQGRRWVFLYTITISNESSVRVQLLERHWIITDANGEVEEVKGPGVIDVTVWRQQQSMTVHLVNLTNPMMMKGPLRETVPVGPLHARIRVPADARVRGVHLLTAGTRVAYEETNRTLTVTVPSVDVHEVIALDF